MNTNTSNYSDTHRADFDACRHRIALVRRGSQTTYAIVGKKGVYISDNISVTKLSSAHMSTPTHTSSTREGVPIFAWMTKTDMSSLMHRMPVAIAGCEAADRYYFPHLRKAPVPVRTESHPIPQLRRCL